jgi:hypothetical protein
MRFKSNLPQTPQLRAFETYYLILKGEELTALGGRTHSFGGKNSQTKGEELTALGGRTHD